MSVKPHDLPPNAKQVYKGEIFTVWQWQQELYDKSTATFERITRVNAAGVVGVLPNKKIIIVIDEQPHRSPVITVAGGRLEEGENPEEGAKREFLEETGYKAGKLIPWFNYKISHSVVYSNHLFIGRELQKVSEPNPDPGERITIKNYSFDEFLDLGHEPTFQNQALRIMLLEAKLDKDKKENLYNLLYE